MNEQINKVLNYSSDINVLYVEDEFETRSNTVKFLSNIFKNLTVAIDGLDGFNKYKNNKIDLIITDVNMPKLNGLQMLEEIKKINQDIYIIILSRNIESTVLLQSIKLNVESYLQKSNNFDSLLISIKKIVEKIELELESQNHKYYLEQYLTLIDKNSIISKTNTEGILTFVNDNFCKISGYRKEELLGKKQNLTKDHENPETLYSSIWDTVKTKGKVWEGILKNKSKSGSSYYVRTVITPIKDIKGNIVEYITIRDNINSTIDDKKYLFEQIEDSDLSILVVLQIDEFDIFEKFYNNIIMDQIENNFAFNLLTYLPSDNIFKNVYSLGAGRFALLMKVNSFSQIDFDIKEYLNQFSDNVKNSSLKFDNLEFNLSITVSYAVGKYMLYEDCITGLENAIKDRNGINFSNDCSIIASKEAKHNLDMIKTVKIALDSYNIVSYCQPIINNKTKEIEKYESLVRLIDESGNIISPFSFLEISKKGNYYNKITQRVLENSLKILESIKTELSINISFSDLEKDQIRKDILNQLENHKHCAHRLIFELLEDENVKNFNLIKEFIHKIKKKGVQIAIDDFGAGYSNFERILEFEPDIIKIDGSLIRNIETDAFSKNLVETIALFAKKQNIKTIGEFVENESIFNILNEIGIDYSQGFYFGKPQCL